MKSITEQTPGEETAAISEIIQLVWQPSLLDKTIVHSHFTQAVLATSSTHKTIQTINPKGTD